MSLKLFISYSLSKTHDKAATSRAVGLAKETIASYRSDQLSWLDPMEDPGLGGIRAKVEKALLEADALIADCTTSVPNVMFEIGFARACGYPIIPLVNLDAFQSGSLKAYFDFLRQDKKHPLASDLGDLEFLTYSKNIHLAGEKANFKAQLTHLLDHLAARLSPGACLLSSGVKRFRKTTLQLTDRNLEREDPPLLRLLGGWLDQVVDELEEAGLDSFEVESDYYTSCFQHFTDAETDQALAIADLSDPTEQIWSQQDPDTDLAVGERIFLINAAEFYGDNLRSVFETLRRHASKHAENGYQMMVARAGHPDQPRDHIFSDTVARDLLLIPPDLVGGYVKKNGRTYLRIQSSAENYDRARAYYEGVKSTAFTYDRGWRDSADLRAAWLQKEKLGIWNTEWTFDERTDDYYMNFDLNIRCWIPHYERLIATAAEEILRASASNLASKGSPAAILEVGSGTGALTEYAYRLLGNGGNSHADSGWGSFVCVDKSSLMHHYLDDRIRRLEPSPEPVLAIGTAFDALGQEVERQAPFDIICGSLVLTHILQHEVETHLHDMLERCRRLLAPHGALIFADAFFLEPQSRDAGRRYWESWMVRHGLSEDVAGLFLDNNHEMIETVTQDQLRTIGREHGFRIGGMSRVPGAPNESPFRVLIMNRVDSSTEHAA